MVFAVGLTGNLASGKTTAAQIFASFGVEVFNADDLAKQLTEKNSPAYQEIKSHFGEQVLRADGSLDRKALRTLIFNEPSERLWLEQMLHPLIRQGLEKQVQACKSTYCIVEIPLLLNKEGYPYLNEILLITAPLEIQIARVKARDHCSTEEALAILSAQPELALRKKHADRVVVNDLGLEQLRSKLEALHEQYLKKAYFK